MGLAVYCDLTDEVGSFRVVTLSVLPKPSGVIKASHSNLQRKSPANAGLEWYVIIERYVGVVEPLAVPCKEAFTAHLYQATIDCSLLGGLAYRVLIPSEALSC